MTMSIILIVIIMTRSKIFHVFCLKHPLPPEVFLKGKQINNYHLIQWIGQKRLKKKKSQKDLTEKPG